MPRYFDVTTTEELEKKVLDLFGGRLDPYQLRNKLGKDLKVNFDCENFESSGNWDGLEGLLGINTLDNGLVFWGMLAGGDWEQPCYFILYQSGNKIRAYVPTDGNPWNTTTKEAYGNDEEDDLKNAKKRYKDKFACFDEEDDVYFDDIQLDFEAELIKKDILNRLQKKD